jgi:imidazolonepropionase-like amidohydrolase
MLGVKGGMPFYEALKAITINSARICGIDNITGSIAENMDADFQIYEKDCNPLDILSEPKTVIINGVTVSTAD